MILASLSLLMAISATSETSAQADSFVAMTYNIRFGTANDGPNHWDLRRDHFMEVLAQHDADILGLQEALDFQIDEIIERFPGYRFEGVGRDDGERAGEWSPILFKTERYRFLDGGTFWLSDTPDVVASITWDNVITRICTWVHLQDRTNNRDVWVFNTHMDHVGQNSRERSAELIAAKIREWVPEGHAVIVMGDLNAGEDNPAFRYLDGQIERASDPDVDPDHQPLPAPTLIHAFRALHPEEEVVGTFNAFRFGQINGAMIDHIWVSPHLRPVRAEIDRQDREERYPSDHFPMIAEIEWIVADPS